MEAFRKGIFNTWVLNRFTLNLGLHPVFNLPMRFSLTNTTTNHHYLTTTTSIGSQLHRASLKLLWQQEHLPHYNTSTQSWCGDRLSQPYNIIEETNQVFFTFLGALKPQNDLILGREDISPKKSPILNYNQYEF